MNLAELAICALVSVCVCIRKPNNEDDDSGDGGYKYHEVINVIVYYSIAPSAMLCALTARTKTIAIHKNVRISERKTKHRRE